MPVVATSKEPAKQHIKREATVAWLQKLFSNRSAMSPGGWDDAMVALAHDIDPSGALKIWTRPRPKLNPQIPLEEGLLSGWMLNPPPRGSVVESGGSLAGVLLGTLARINKYGEPEFGLRDGCLAVLRFAVNDLARIPIETALANPKAGALRGFAFQSRTAISNSIVAASPRYRGGANPSAWYGKDVPLDVFDLANAALDVIGALEPRPPGETFVLHDDDRNGTVDVLAWLSAARPVFGGKPVSPSQESVACRAFSTLVAIADTRAADSRPIRDELHSLVDLQLTPPLPGTEDPPSLNAVRAAFLWAGLADQAEADERVRWLVFRGTDNRGSAWTCAESATTLRAIPLYAGGPGHDTLRGYAAKKTGEWMDGLERRQQVGFGSRDETQFIEAWKAAAGRVTLASINPTCGPEPGESKGEIILYAICADGLQVIDEIYVGVPTIVEIQFDAESERKEVPIELSIGGQKLKLIGHRFDDHGRIFRSDPILPGGKTNSGAVWDGSKP